jgi:predicted metal-binding protein
MSCYMKDKVNNTGIDHKMPADTKECATACAKRGRPMALLTSDGKVYQIAGDLAADNNAKLVPHIAHTVSITGDTMDDKGTMMIHASELKMVSK